MLSQIDNLKADNARLHASSRNWFEKYQGAILSKEESMKNTPVKRKRIINDKEEELLFLDS